jgi:hypothetical protein
MVTNLNNSSSARALAVSQFYVTPQTGDIGGRSRKRVRLSSPMSPHAISNLRAPIDDDDGDEVELDGDKLNFNLLIPQPKLLHFIYNNFVCKECGGKISDRNIVVERIGCASNVFFTCGGSSCAANDKILANQSKKEASGLYRRKHRELPRHLGDYNINRQVVLACQMSFCQFHVDPSG